MLKNYACKINSKTLNKMIKNFGIKSNKRNKLMIVKTLSKLIKTKKWKIFGKNLENLSESSKNQE